MPQNLTSFFIFLIWKLGSPVLLASTSSMYVLLPYPGGIPAGLRNLLDARHSPQRKNGSRGLLDVTRCFWADGCH